MFKSNWWKAFGPGIIFASTAIGVSHLIQSTRAGADYGYALVWVIILANFFKYPFFEFGSRFAQATGTTLLDGYKKLGKWTLWLYLGITVISMFTVTGAVSFVTTALLANLLGITEPSSFVYVALGIYAFCISILLIGKFSALDKFIKFIAIFLVLSTFAAFVLVLSTHQQGDVSREMPNILADKTHWVFIIALMGWMPTAVDLSAWNSIWTVERIKETGYKPTLKQTLLDFKIGYITSGVLAIIFLVLGAEIMFYPGKTFPNDAAGFTTTLIGLFTESLGQWSYFIIAISAFSVMLSTTITVLDGYGRALSLTVKLALSERKLFNYSFWLLLVGVGSVLVITVFKNQLKQLVDLATITSFLIAPVVAYLNYRLIFSAITPVESQPSKAMKIWALVGIVFLVLFSFVFLFISLS